MRTRFPTAFTQQDYSDVDDEDDDDEGNHGGGARGLPAFMLQNTNPALPQRPNEAQKRQHQHQHQQQQYYSDVDDESEENSESSNEDDNDDEDDDDDDDGPEALPEPRLRPVVPMFAVPGASPAAVSGGFPAHMLAPATHAVLSPSRPSFVPALSFKSAYQASSSPPPIYPGALPPSSSTVTASTSTSMPTPLAAAPAAAQQSRPLPIGPPRTPPPAPLAPTSVTSAQPPSSAAWPPPPQEKTDTQLYDYSDMEEDEEEPSPVPVFPVPEQRIPLDAKVRVDRDVPVGGRNQDYLGLAYIYKLQRPYSDHDYKATCVLCHLRPSQDVFFPCEHRCVCRQCISSEKFCEDRQLSATPGGYSLCPLCATTIKRILPHERGAETEKYWRWVEEVSPELPPGFLRNFKHSASVLEQVYITGTLSHQVANTCNPS